MDQFDDDVRSLVKVRVVHGSWKREAPNRVRIDVSYLFVGSSTMSMKLVANDISRRLVLDIRMSRLWLRICLSRLGLIIPR